eukprot:352421-Chlamydomonas_euryale.AAC.68
MNNLALALGRNTVISAGISSAWWPLESLSGACKANHQGAPMVWLLDMRQVWRHSDAWGRRVVEESLRLETWFLVTLFTVYS